MDSVNTPEGSPMMTRASPNTAAASNGESCRFGFRARTSRLNWKALAALDSNRLVGSGDVSQLQSIMENLCFSQISPAELELAPTEHIAKLVTSLQHSLELVFALYARSFESNEELLAQNRIKTQTIQKLSDGIAAANARIVRMETEPCSQCVGLSEKLAKSLAANASIAASEETFVKAAHALASSSAGHETDLKRSEIASITPYSRQRRSAAQKATSEGQKSATEGQRGTGEAEDQDLNDSTNLILGETQKIATLLDKQQGAIADVSVQLASLNNSAQTRQAEESKNRQWWLAQFQHAVEVAVAKSVARARGSFVVPESLIEASESSAEVPTVDAEQEELTGHSELIPKK